MSVAIYPEGIPKPLAGGKRKRHHRKVPKANPSRRDDSSRAIALLGIPLIAEHRPEKFPAAIPPGYDALGGPCTGGRAFTTTG